MRVERGQRLVEEQDGGVAGERPRERHPLALAAGELVRPRLPQVGDAEPPEQVVHAGAAAVRDVLLHGHVREERVLLEHEPDGALLGREVDLPFGVEPHRPPERDAAPFRVCKPGDAAQHGRLACTRGPDERDASRVRP